MIIIDNLFDAKTQDKLERVFLDNSFPWYIIPETVADYNSCVVDNFTKESPQLAHVLYDERGPRSEWYASTISRLFPVISEKTGKPVLENKLRRIKTNLLMPNEGFPETHHNTAHVDYAYYGINTLLYYVNDSDGDTWMFNETLKLGYIEENKKTVLSLNQRITPKKGTAILFNSNILHASSTPTKNPRCVINFCWNYL